MDLCSLTWQAECSLTTNRLNHGKPCGFLNGFRREESMTLAGALSIRPQGHLKSSVCLPLKAKVFYSATFPQPSWPDNQPSHRHMTSEHFPLPFFSEKITPISRYVFFTCGPPPATQEPHPKSKTLGEVFGEAPTWHGKALGKALGNPCEGLGEAGGKHQGDMSLGEALGKVTWQGPGQAPM